jgi:UDP-N-acetylglucosamine kinase
MTAAIDIDALLPLIIANEIPSTTRATNTQPQAYLIAGQPGSGKSRLAEMAATRSLGLGENPINIDVDQLRRYDPRYASLAAVDPDEAFATTHPIASQWADSIRDHAIHHHLDIVCQGTFKTAANTQYLCHLLRSEGYHVTLMIKLVPMVISLLQIERRYEMQLTGHTREAAPRRVGAQAHNIAADAVPSLLDLVASPDLAIRARLIDSLELYNRTNEKLIVPDDVAPSVIARQILSSPEPSLAFALANEVQTYRVNRGAPAIPDPGSALSAALAMLSQQN